MKTSKLTLVALATALFFGIANADEDDTMDVVVATAVRPDMVELQAPVAIEEAAPEIELPSLAIEAPSLERTRIRLEAERFEVALNEEVD